MLTQKRRGGVNKRDWDLRVFCFLYYYIVIYILPFYLYGLVLYIIIIWFFFMFGVGWYFVILLYVGYWDLVL